MVPHCTWPASTPRRDGISGTCTWSTVVRACDVAPEEKGAYDPRDWVARSEAATGGVEEAPGMTPEQKIRQNAEFIRRLHEAVYEPERLKREQITRTRRRNQRLRQQTKQHKETQ